MQACWVLPLSDMLEMLVGRERDTSARCVQTHFWLASCCGEVKPAATLYLMGPLVKIQQQISGNQHAHTPTHKHTQAHTSVKYHGPPIHQGTLAGLSRNKNTTSLDPPFLNDRFSKRTPRRVSDHVLVHSLSSGSDILYFLCVVDGR